MRQGGSGWHHCPIHRARASPRSPGISFLLKRTARLRPNDRKHASETRSARRAVTTPAPSPDSGPAPPITMKKFNLAVVGYGWAADLSPELGRPVPFEEVAV